MRPTHYCVLLVLAISCLAIIVAWLPEYSGLFRIFAAGILAIGLFDYLALGRLDNISVTRRVNHNLPIYSWSPVKLKIKNHHANTIRFEIYDHHPARFQVEGQPYAVQLKQGQGAELEYRVKPLQRGDARFTAYDLLITSPLGLWRRRLHEKLVDEICVYPNFAEIAHFALLATDNHLSQMGIRRKQRRGEGQDFHQLREYRLGDSLKQIDWKATSRYQKLISREYQDERDQQLIFLVDCGRRMRHLEQGQAHLDQALNAMLLLSYVAIRQGDAAGFLSFAGIERWSPPQKGAHVVQHLLTQSYDLPSTMEAADYLAAARKIAGLQRKRALIIILTNTRDEDHSDLKQAARLLARRHLLVLADLREPGLNETINKPVSDLDSALLYNGTIDYLQRRTQAHESLNHTGAICLDTTAAQLPVKLVNQYLAIKRSGRL